MIIYPAIELQQGHSRPLHLADPHAAALFTADPVAVARHWAQQGAEWLYVTNLDGPLNGSAAHLQALHRPVTILVKRPGAAKPTAPTADPLHQLPINLQQLRAIRQAVPTPIQFGGGLRTLDDIQLALDLGADRVVLGTIAAENPELVELAVEQWGGDRIVVSIEARDGKVQVQGRKAVVEVDAVDVGYRMRALGVKRVLYRDLNADDTNNGANVEASAHLGDITDLQVIACGKITTLDDIARLKAHEHYNIEGVVLNQALYADRLDLAATIALGHQPLRRRSAGIIPYRQQDERIEFLLLFNLFVEQWQFPRGGIHPHEDEQSCARRNFAEETGLPILKFHEACRAVLEYTASIRKYEIERTIVYYLAETNAQAVQLGHEDHCEARWLDVRETWELLTETSPEQLPALDAAMAYLKITG